MKQPKHFTRKQSVYTQIVQQQLNLGQDTANAIQNAKAVVREMKNI